MIGGTEPRINKRPKLNGGKYKNNPIHNKINVIQCSNKNEIKQISLLKELQEKEKLLNNDLAISINDINRKILRISQNESIQVEGVTEILSKKNEYANEYLKKVLAEKHQAMTQTITSIYNNVNNELEKAIENDIKKIIQKKKEDNQSEQSRISFASITSNRCNNSCPSSPFNNNFFTNTNPSLNNVDEFDYFSINGPINNNSNASSLFPFAPKNDIFSNNPFV